MPRSGLMSLKISPNRPRHARTVRIVVFLLAGLLVANLATGHAWAQKDDDKGKGNDDKQDKKEKGGGRDDDEKDDDEKSRENRGRDQDEENDESEDDSPPPAPSIGSGQSGASPQQQPQSPPAAPPAELERALGDSLAATDGFDTLTDSGRAVSDSVRLSETGQPELKAPAEVSLQSAIQLGDRPAIFGVVGIPETPVITVTSTQVLYVVSVTIGVETRGETAKEAAEANAELMNKVIAALKGLGIADDQISTSWYSVNPVYEWRSPPCIEIYPQPPECAPKSEITGYSASNSVTITLDADEDAGKVIDEAVAAGATNVNGAYFFVSAERQEEVRNSLIEEAIANARGRADKAAAAVEMQVTGVKSISLNDVSFPVFYKDFAEGASTPVLPGQQEVSMTVQVTFVMS